MNNSPTVPEVQDSQARKARHKKNRSSVSLATCRKLPISLNIYDLIPPSKFSSFLWFTGLAICHSGVVIGDAEWAFGGHDVEGVTGVYVTRPGEVPENAHFRTNLSIGVTILDDRSIKKELDRLRAEYTGPTYDLLNKNCNHFAADVCLALCGTRPPAWINRIAGYGSKLPVCVSQAWVDPPVSGAFGDDSDDEALLLPPSEVAPMSRNCEEETLSSASDVSDDDQSHVKEPSR